MLKQIHLENFKANRDVPVRLEALTILTGLNGSGKSTVLQAIGALRQSYDASGNTNGMLLSGHLVQLGQYRDVLSEGAEADLAIRIVEEGVTNRWAVRGPLSAHQLRFEEQPEVAPRFITTRDFQYLQANRIAPRTLYPQAPQLERDIEFLGTQGEYSAHFLDLEGKRTVSEHRTFPRSGTGISQELFDKVAPTDCLLDQVAGWLQQLSPGASLIAGAVDGTDEVLLQFNYLGRLGDVKSNAYRPTNVGFGLTYSLPVIVACLAAPSGALLLLENPEAHLHPRGQAALGELMARCSSDGVQIIAETHSDHVLNGVRLAVKNKQISAENTALHFFSRSTDTGDASVESPAILEDGRVSNWPAGFFDQWDKDVMALLG